MHLVVVIPCLNEAATLGAVLDGIPRSIPGISRVTKLVVDDGSTDETVTVAELYHAAVISHGRNFGYGTAFRTAVEFALSVAADVMVHIDGDGQFDSADIATLVRPIVDGEADLVLASRFADPALRPVMPRAKYLGNLAMSRLLSALLNRQFFDVSCGYRAYSTEALLHLDVRGDFTHSQETVLDLAYKKLRIVEIPVRVQYFAGRVSRIADNLPRYAARSLGIIVRVYRDYFPLRFFNAVAGVFLLAGLLLSGRLLRHFAATGQFYGEIWAGATGAFCLALSALFLLTGMLAQLMDRNRITQERILYMMKREARDRRVAEGDSSQLVTRHVAARHRQTPHALRAVGTKRN